jgi:chromosome segregation ATPase
VLHEQHIVELADQNAERDREARALQSQLDEARLRTRELAALVPESAEQEFATLRLARDAAREEAAELAGEAAEVRELQLKLDALAREKESELTALRQHVRRLEPFAARYREAELKADAVARDRDTQVAALRARADELESRLRGRPESERVRKAGA